MFVLSIAIKTKLEKILVRKGHVLVTVQIVFNFFLLTYAEAVNTFRSPIPHGGGLRYFFRHIDSVNSMSTIIYSAEKLFFKNTTKIYFLIRDKQNTSLYLKRHDSKLDVM